MGIWGFWGNKQDCDWRRDQRASDMSKTQNWHMSVYTSSLLVFGLLAFARVFHQYQHCQALWRAHGNYMKISWTESVTLDTIVRGKAHCTAIESISRLLHNKTFSPNLIEEFFWCNFTSLLTCNTTTKKCTRYEQILGKKM